MFEIEASLGYLINRAAILLRAEVKRAFDENGIDATPEEWAILAVLLQNGAMSINALADKTVKDRTTVTRFVDRLQDKAWIGRHRGAPDARVVNVDLTKTGRATVQSMARLVQPILVRGMGGVTKSNLRTTMESLAAIVANLKQV